MKVGILTFHWSYNFGANLQALATQNALRAAGVEPVIVNYRDPTKVAHYQRVTDPQQAEQHEQFCRDYLTESPVLRDSDEIEAYCNDALDAVLVGSDAVFSIVANNSPKQLLKRFRSKSDRTYTMGSSQTIPAYFLPWKKETKVKRGSIAASSTGTQFYFLSMGHYRQLWRALRNFDALTVRDNWTRMMVRFLTAGTRTPSLCIDPVFSLNRHAPDFVTDTSDTASVLVSGNFQDAWLHELIGELVNRGFTTANLPNPEKAFIHPATQQTIDLPMGPREWFSTIANAKGFLGIRFHALVSCLVNRTPFISVDTGPPALRPLYRQSSKYHDMCKRASSPQRYFDKHSIYRIAIPELVDRMFESDSMANAEAFAESAADTFDLAIQNMLESFDSSSRSVLSR